MDHTDRFTGRQEDYQAGRPSYAQGLLDWLEALYTPPGDFAAADVGSGTGKLSAQLLAADSASAAWSPTGTCGARQNRFWERIPVSPPGTARTGTRGCRTGPWTSSQPPRRSTGSTAPPLPGSAAGSCTPGGQVYLIWNIRTDAPVNQALAGLFRVHCPDFRGFSGGMAEDDPRIRAFFGERYEKRRFPNPLTLDRDRFLRRCFSSSYSLREGDAGYPAYLAALEDLFGQFSQNGLLLQPNETLV